MAKTMTYAGFIKSFRDLARKGNEMKLARMYLLTEVKPMSAIWRMGPYSTWAALLEKENLCSVAYFNGFEEALKVLRRSTIDRIGADLAVVVARVEPSLRDATIKKIDTYIDQHEVPPSRMLAWGFVRSLRFIPPSALGRVTRHVRH